MFSIRWLYRLQHRLAITPTEAFTLLGLFGLLGIGWGIQQWRAEHQPDLQAIYAATDSLFRYHTARETLQVMLPAGERVRLPEQATDTLRLDLNKASQYQLEKLPRIGPALAARIVAYREQHGPFRSVQEILNVRGIGKKTLNRIAPFLFVTSSDSL